MEVAKKPQDLPQTDGAIRGARGQPLVIRAVPAAKRGSAPKNALTRGHGSSLVSHMEVALPVPVPFSVVSNTTFSLIHRPFAQVIFPYSYSMHPRLDPKSIN